MVDVMGPLEVIKGMPLYVAIPLSLTTKSLDTLVYALVARFPGSSGLITCPSKLTNSPAGTPAGGMSGSTCKHKQRNRIYALKLSR